MVDQRENRAVVGEQTPGDVDHPLTLLVRLRGDGGIESEKIREENTTRGVNERESGWTFRGGEALR